jgi:hypothetical protein
MYSVYTLFNSFIRFIDSPPDWWTSQLIRLVNIHENFIQKNIHTVTYKFRKIKKMKNFHSLINIIKGLLRFKKLPRALWPQ